MRFLKDADPKRYGAIQEGIRHLQNFKARKHTREDSRADRSSSATPTSMRTRGTSSESRKGRNYSNPMEQDFTSSGVVGNLGCPFASMTKIGDKRRLGSQTSGSQRPGRLPTPPQTKISVIVDPIAAEFHAEIVPSPPPSVTASASKCPIRFLDQHSPEEVAQYFENHKHEIPRSHEVCVKRYQTNSESIRQLDAKYGNLVNMIQGLGVKHQPLLPTAEEEGVAAMERKSMDKVEQWAEGVAGDDVAEAEESPDAEDEDQHREGRFERPLKEIRVGESPSRPWGISVPLEHGLATSDDFKKKGEGAQLAPFISALTDAEGKQSPSRGKCRFGHGADTGTAPPIGQTAVDDRPSQSRPTTSEPTSATKAKAVPSCRESKSSQTPFPKHPQMVFNGPVFIGYPAEQAATLLQQFGAGVNIPKA